MFTHVFQGLSVVAEGLSDIKPDFNFFPFVPKLYQIAGGTIATVLIVMVILLVIGIAMAVGGKITSSRGVQNVGFGFIVVALIGAAVAANAGGLINWGSLQRLV